MRKGMTSASVKITMRALCKSSCSHLKKHGNPTGPDTSDIQGESRSTLTTLTFAPRSPKSSIYISLDHAVLVVNMLATAHSQITAEFHHIHQIERTGLKLTHENH